MDKCLICDGEAKLKYLSHPGYVYGKTYDVYVCDGCGVSFVQPLAVEKSDYELIYRDAEFLPGYNRYYQLSRKIKNAVDPLRELSLYGDEYAFIISRIKRLAGEHDEILEVGCGLGYLTYSLRCSNYQATGIDISSVSISKARELYGPYYEHCDIVSFNVFNKKKYRFIILSEVIEHVTDPVSLLKNLRSLLDDDGIILLTTPNRSSFPQESLWMTDAPPIHLWWFSEKSMSYIAEKAFLKSRVYKGYVSDNLSYHYWKRGDDLTNPTFVPEFDGEGHLVRNSQDYSELVLPKWSLLRHLYARLVPEAAKVMLVRFRNSIRETQKTERSCTMFVEMKKL